MLLDLLHVIVVLPLLGPELLNLSLIGRSFFVGLLFHLPHQVLQLLGLGLESLHDVELVLKLVPDRIKLTLL